MKTIQMKGILIYLLTLVLIVGLGMTLEAQNKVDSNLLPAKKKYVQDDIKVHILVLFDDMSIESDDILIELINMSEETRNSRLINDNFTLFLKRHNKYAISLTKEGYNKRTVLINTECPDDEDWTINMTMRLSSSNKDDMAGVIYFDNKTLSFESKPFPKK